MRLPGRSRARLLPTALVALAAVSIPFVADGHFGVLGTGFNVDMSQHLFAADWLADPTGLSPSLFRNGYPLGPHALAVAANEVTGELTIAFTGVTIAVPVLAALTALAALDSLSRLRAVVVAVLTAVAYLAASYLAQGAFKELFEVAFLLGFALWLRDLSRRPRTAPGSGLFALLPGAVIAAGALYVYSWPGLAWLAGTLGLWAWSSSSAGARPGGDPPRAALRARRPRCSSSSPPPRSTGSASSGPASTRSPSGPAPGCRRATAGARGPGDGAGGAAAAGRGSGPTTTTTSATSSARSTPARCSAIWPSGDFRVNPGDGSVPAPVFYLGAAARRHRARRSAWRRVPAGGDRAARRTRGRAAIWLAARIGSTPYTTAKALQMLAPWRC